jgi:hypothetical protein
LAFSNAQQSRIFAGYTHLSGTVRQFQHVSTTDAIDVTTIADTAKQFIPGLQSGSISVDMMLDNTSGTGSQWDDLYQWRSTLNPLPVTAMPFGITAGSMAALQYVIDTQLTPSVQPKDAVLVSLTGEATDLVDFGAVVETLNAITVDTNGTGQDNGALTSNGGVAHLHVTAFSGLTSDAIILEHSTNNSVWATLGTFTTVTALTSQRLVIAAGTTVNRYLRISDDVTGTGSITRICSFARR